MFVLYVGKSWETREEMIVSCNWKEFRRHLKRYLEYWLRYQVPSKTPLGVYKYLITNNKRGELDAHVSLCYDDRCMYDIGTSFIRQLTLMDRLWGQKTKEN